MTQLTPYPAYRDSDLGWLPGLPEHWELRRLRTSVGGCISGVWGSEPNGTDDMPCIRVADFDRSRMRVRIEAPTLRGIAPKERKNRLLRKGDLLIEKSGGGDLQPVGAIVLYDHDVEAVCSNFVARMPVSAHCDATYLTYLHSHLYATRLNARSIKQTTGIQNLDVSSYLDEVVAFPPVSEQTAIARFLGDADRRIRRYMVAKQKLIAGLVELKRAIIHRAVTGGIDVRTGQPYPTYKDSGVAWLERVPERWTVVALQRVTRSRCDGPFGSGIKSSHYTTNGVRVVRLQNIGHAEFKGANAAYISEEHCASLGDHSVAADDLLIAGLGDNRHPSGRACVAPARILPAMVKADCFRFRLDTDSVDPQFVAHQLTATATEASNLLSTGATRQRTNLQTTATRAISFPGLAEQVLIVKSIARSTSNIRSAAEVARRQIDHMNEYRTRLIADVVTGKLDVREAAAALPDQAPT